MEGPGSELIKESTNQVWKEAVPDDKTWEESMGETRSNAEQILTAWLDSMDGELDVIFLPIGAIHPLRAALISCETRAENENDPFTLPDEFAEAASFLKDLQEAEKEEEPVFVHEEQLPPLPDPEVPGA
jgi:hypothetical protein